ncbi:MAG: glucoamylase, partial [Spirochaetota bacterium]
QRYGMDALDKGIYRQEDNVAHGITIIARCLLAAFVRKTTVPDYGVFLDAMERGVNHALSNYYRREIHLFYSTTSIHESAMEEGYTIWVNYAYLCMLRLVEEVSSMYDCHSRFTGALELKKGFETTLENVFSHSDRYVRRLRPDGVVDLRPDITLLSPFFFGRDGVVPGNPEVFRETVRFIRDNLWDPDLGMLQRYLPFIEDPSTHIHAGNGPWIQYTAMLAQYYFSNGMKEEGESIMSIIDGYLTREGFLCEHLTTAERFYEFKRLEWMPGNDFDKEFDPHILAQGISYDHIVEELTHMKLSYEEVERQCTEDPSGYITFATPLMWSHAEYAMALVMRTEVELAALQYRL